MAMAATDAGHAMPPAAPAAERVDEAGMERGHPMPYRRSLMPQLHARQHREALQERAAREAAAAHESRLQAQRRLLDQASARAGASASDVARLGDAARLEQIDPRAHLYAETEDEAAATAAAAAVIDGAHVGGRIPHRASCLREQYNDRVPRCEQRSAVQRIYAADFGRREEAIARRQHPNQRACGRLHGHAARGCIDTRRAEKELHERTYMRDNEEAYRQVAAMQRSVLGYDDTAKQTVAQLRAAAMRDNPAMRAAAAMATRAQAQ